MLVSVLYAVAYIRGTWQVSVMVQSMFSLNNFLSCVRVTYITGIWQLSCMYWIMFSHGSLFSCFIIAYLIMVHSKKWSFFFFRRCADKWSKRLSLKLIWAFSLLVKYDSCLNNSTDEEIWYSSVLLFDQFSDEAFIMLQDLQVITNVINRLCSCGLKSLSWSQLLP